MPTGALADGADCTDLGGGGGMGCGGEASSLPTSIDTDDTLSGVGSPAEGGGRSSGSMS